MSVDAHSLQGRWLHSHEEDTADQRVYRPASHPFPPSRGRGGFELRPDGTCTRIGIAARDGSTEQPCTWRLEPGGESRIVIDAPGTTAEVLRVVSASADRLVVRK